MSWRILILKYIPWVQSFEPYEFKVLNSKTWNESRVMIVLNIKNWNENRVVQLEENWTLEWKQGNFEPRNLGMKTFLLCFFSFWVLLFWLQPIMVQKFLPIKPWNFYPLWLFVMFLTYKLRLQIGPETAVWKP